MIPLAAAFAASMVMVAPALVARGEDYPPVFTSMPLDQAKERSMETDRVLVVVATATWCGPCKEMQRTSWRDERVTAWVRENAVVVPLDVDQSKAEAGQLGISAMPTLVAMRRGVELSRTTGGIGAEKLLAFLESAKANKGGSLGDPAFLAAMMKDRETLKPKGRLQLMRGLLEAERYDDAVVEAQWLWQNVPLKDGALAPIKAGELPDVMRLIAKKSPAALEKLKVQRNAVEPKATGAKADREVLLEWFTLNDAIGENKKTLAWFDGLAGKPGADGEAKRVLEPLLVALASEGRYADAGKLIGDPYVLSRSAGEALKLTRPAGTDAGPKPRTRKKPATEVAPSAGELRYADRLGIIYASLLAAGRQRDADGFAERMIKLEDTGWLRLAMVERALLAKQARETQGPMLEEALRRGAVAKDAQVRWREMMK